jgi:uncharacterized protein YjgD (DUF1641 family)
VTALAQTVEEIPIERLLTEENVLVLSKVIDILKVANNKYGLLDVVQGLLEDEDTVAKVVNWATNDRVLSLSENLGSMTRLLELMSNEENILALQDLLGLVQSMRKVGLLDPIKGMLEDEETLTKVMGLMTNDKILNLTQNLDNVLDLVDYLTKEDTILAIKDALDIVKALRDTGLLDPIKGMLRDDDVMRMIGTLFSSDFMMNVIRHFDEMIKDLGTFDLTNLKYYTLLVNETGEAIKTGNIKPVKSVFDLMKLFKDPEIQVGMGVVVTILKHIGKYHSKYVTGSGIQSKQ